MERIFHLIKRPENPVELLIKKQKEETAKAINKAKIMKHLNFSSEQMEIFSASFNYYILSKWAQEASFLSKHPEVEMDAKIWGPKSESRGIIKENEINDQAIKKLKDEMQKLIDSAPKDATPNPRSILNAANYASTLYIDCRLNYDKDFNREFQKKTDFINTKIIVRRPD